MRSAEASKTSGPPVELTPSKQNAFNLQPERSQLKLQWNLGKEERAEALAEIVPEERYTAEDLECCTPPSLRFPLTPSTVGTSPYPVPPLTPSTSSGTPPSVLPPLTPSIGTHASVPPPLTPSAASDSDIETLRTCALIEDSMLEDSTSYRPPSVYDYFNIDDEFESYEDGDGIIDRKTSLFKICRMSSNATGKASSVQSYIGGQWTSYARVLCLQGLHRGVRISTLVRNFGAIFREGTAVVVRGENAEHKKDRWYHKSGPPMCKDEALSGFISHSWATSGMQKGLALSMYFFNGRASIAMFLFLVLFGVPTLVGMKSAEAEKETILIAMTFVVVGSYVCYFMLLVLGDYIPCFLHGLDKQRYFLDICCISQNNDDKMKGVYHLAEYVMVSKKVIVCYTERYTTRLWCVFEMAVFFARLKQMTRLAKFARSDMPTRAISKHTSKTTTTKSTATQRSWVKCAMDHKDAAEFVLLPLSLPPIAIGISISLQACLFLLLAYVVTQWQLCAILLACCVGVTLSFLGFGAMKLHEAGRKMYEDFKNFSLDQTQCFSQEDRAIIYESINSFWATGSEADDAAGLREFERFVREDIAEYIWENFATPVNALRCLFTTSGLPIMQSLLVLVSLGALLPLLMAAFAMDAFIGDSFGKARGLLIPIWQRATFKRIILWILMITMGGVSSIHCFGYVVEPKVVLPDDLMFKMDPEDGTYPKELIAVFKQHVLVPPDFSIDASFGLWFLSATFGLLALLFWFLALSAIFLRRHAVLSVQQTPKPDPLASLSVADIVVFCKAWFCYIRSIQPGSDMYWRRIMMMEFFEFGLQFLKLASYSGKDLISGETFPAQDDQVVIFHTAVLCLDILCIGLCIYFRAIFAAIVSEIFVDVLYSIAPLVALGAFFEPAAWYQLRDDDMPMLYFLATIFPMLRMLSSLSKLDQISLQQSRTKDPERCEDADVSDDELHEQRRCSDFSVKSPAGNEFAGKASGASNLSDKIRAGYVGFIGITGTQGRQKGFLPALELILRILIICGLLLWILPAMSNPCQQLSSATWRCDWVTHPIFESPPCDCKMLSGNTYLRKADEALECRLDEIYTIMEVATSVEYFFIRGNPLLPSCVLDEDRLRRFDTYWLQHARGVQFLASLLTTSTFPLAFAEATKLRSLQIYLTQISELPDWFSNLRSLQTFRFVMGQLMTYPLVLESLPDLQLVELDGSPVCLDALAVENMQRRFEKVSCDFGRSASDTIEAAANSSNSTMSNSTECAQEGGVWVIVKEGAKFCNAPATTACTDLCVTMLTLLSNLDTIEPKGAFNKEEINSQPFQDLLKVWRPIDESKNLLRSSGQLGCSLAITGCQVDDHLERGLNESHMWLTTFSRLCTSVVDPSGISDCSECSGTMWMPYYSLELQDPSDPTKSKN